jgi:hypothetical protein
MPDIKPATKGAPEANAMPKHNGKATKNTERPAGKSCFNQTNLNTCIVLFILEQFYAKMLH